MTVAVCDSLASPVLVGIVRPLVLLPPAALTGWSPEQVEMVLLHELAHVRRWGNLVNLVQRVVEALLFFHPAVWWVSRWVRRDREECCDAVVVAHIAKPQAYAELLVALASTHQPLAGLAMARHPLTRRIRRVLNLEDETMLVSRSTLSMVVFFLIAILTVAIWQPSTQTGADDNALAEPVFSEEAPEDTQTADKFALAIGFPNKVQSGDRERIAKELTEEGYEVTLTAQTIGDYERKGMSVMIPVGMRPRANFENDAQRRLACRIYDENRSADSPFPTLE